MTKIARFLPSLKLWINEICYSVFVWIDAWKSIPIPQSWPSLSPTCSKQDLKSVDLVLAANLAAQIIAADALSRNFKASQSFGKWISLVLPEVFNSTSFEGFSYYSSELCHEERYGNGTCSELKARDDLCEGKCYFYFVSNIFILSRSESDCCSLL